MMPSALKHLFPSMQRHLLCGLIALLVTPFLSATAQPEPDESIYYVTARSGATLYSESDSTRAYLELDFQTPVHVLDRGNTWSHVRTRDGAAGYVRSSELSNVWIRVSKSKNTVYLYEGTTLKGKIPADFGYNVFLDKERRGSVVERDHWRTPEGTFYVVEKNPNSQYYKALVLNYPKVDDAERGYQRGVISRAERDAIVRAQENFTRPPMNTALGGWIEIHGDGTGARSNWTQGCVAVPNVQMNVLWRYAEVGTPVVIEP